MAPSAILSLVRPPPLPLPGAPHPTAQPPAPSVLVQGSFSLLPEGGVRVGDLVVRVAPRTVVQRARDPLTGSSYLGWKGVGAEAEGGEWRLQLVRATERDEMAIMRILMGLPPAPVESIDKRRRMAVPSAHAVERNSIVLVDEATREVVKVLPLHALAGPSQVTRVSARDTTAPNSSHSAVTSASRATGATPLSPTWAPKPKESPIARQVDSIVRKLSPGLGTWTEPHLATDAEGEVDRVEQLNPDMPDPSRSQLKGDPITVTDDELLYDFSPPPVPAVASASKPGILSRMESLVGLNPWVNAKTNLKRQSLMSVSSAGTGQGYQTALEETDAEEGTHSRETSSETVLQEEELDTSSIYDVEPPSPARSQVSEWSRFSSLKTVATPSNASAVGAGDSVRFDRTFKSPSQPGSTPSDSIPAKTETEAKSKTKPLSSSSTHSPPPAQAEADAVLLQFFSSSSTIRSRPVGLDEIESGAVVPVELREPRADGSPSDQLWPQLIASLSWASTAWGSLTSWWWSSVQSVGQSTGVQAWADWSLPGAEFATLFSPVGGTTAAEGAPAARARPRGAGTGRGEWGAERRRVSVMLFDENGQWRRAYVGR